MYVYIYIHFILFPFHELIQVSYDCITPATPVSTPRVQRTDLQLRSSTRPGAMGSLVVMRERFGAFGVSIFPIYSLWCYLEFPNHLLAKMWDLDGVCHRERGFGWFFFSESNQSNDQKLWGGLSDDIIFIKKKDWGIIKPVDLSIRNGVLNDISSKNLRFLFTWGGGMSRRRVPGTMSFPPIPWRRSAPDVVMFCVCSWRCNKRSCTKT